MRLLNVHTLEFSEFYSDAPKYVIASHMWSAGTEATIKDMRNRRNTDKVGYKKVEGFAKYVQEQIGYVEWLWIDSCCVNQASSQELSETLNSMFRWYSKAEVCLVYMADVSNAKDEYEFRRSFWFSRAWNLQELLAPHIVVFLSQDWKVIGHKGGDGWTENGFQVSKGLSLEPVIATITGIPEYILHDYSRSKGLSVEERLAWYAGRNTHREEDMSYSMLGIFDVAMPLLYGEGAERARKRLLEEISKASTATSSALEEHEQMGRKRLKRIRSPFLVSGPAYEPTSSATGPSSVSAGGSAHTQNDIADSYPISNTPGHHDHQPLGLLAPTERPMKFKVFANLRNPLQVRFCYIFIALGVFVIGGSLAVGLYYSIARDRMGDGFTTAGWMTAVGTMVPAAPVAKHYPHCKCWKTSRTNLLP